MFRLVHDLAPNHDAGENLDPFLVAFHNPRMNTNAIAHSKGRRIRFLLFFLDDVDDPIHEIPSVPPAGRANIFSRTTSNCKLKSLNHKPTQLRRRKKLIGNRLNSSLQCSSPALNRSPAAESVPVS